MKKINWKVYTIADSNYSKAVYSWSKLKTKGAFYVSKRLYYKLNGSLRRIAAIKKDLDKPVKFCYYKGK